MLRLRSGARGGGPSLQTAPGGRCWGGCRLEAAGQFQPTGGPSAAARRCASSADVQRQNSASAALAAASAALAATSASGVAATTFAVRPSGDRAKASAACAKT